MFVYLLFFLSLCISLKESSESIFASPTDAWNKNVFSPLFSNEFNTFSAQETIHKQAVLCHRVLRRIQDVVQQSRLMDRVTWEALLAFLLAINDALLAPPTVKGNIIKKSGWHIYPGSPTSFRSKKRLWSEQVTPLQKRTQVSFVKFQLSLNNSWKCFQKMYKLKRSTEVPYYY